MQRIYDLEERLIQFGNDTIDVVESLPKTYAGNYLGNQLVRSATSPLLNYGEVQGAESLADFIHKMKICLKELRETYNCLRLIKRRNWINLAKLDSLLKENGELIAIFTTSIKTATKRKFSSPE